MSATEWYCAIGNERKGPFTEEQVKGLVAAGVVGDHTKVWSAELADWMPLYQTPLRALLGDRAIAPPPLAPAAPTPPPAAAPAASFQPHAATAGFAPAPAYAAAPHAPPRSTLRLRDNRGLWRTLQSFIGAYIVASVIRIGLIIKVNNPDDLYNRLVFLDGVGLMLMGVVALLCIILWFVWQYRATANLFYLRGPQTITPAGAVYWYFIPVAWFWKPLEAMRNLFVGFGVPQRQHPQLTLWWLLVMVVVAEGVVVAMFDVQIRSSVQEAAFWHVAEAILDILVCAVAIRVVRNIGEAEEASLAAAGQAPA